MTITAQRLPANDNIGEDEPTIIPDLDEDPYLVTLENAGSTSFRVKHVKKWFALEPGESQDVPWDLATRCCGDPRKQNADKRNMARLEAYKSLQVRYGVYDRTDQHEPPDVLWDRYVPQLKVYDLDGRRIPMVMDDPEGDRYTSKQLDDNMTIAMLNRNIEKMQEQIDGLETSQTGAESAQVAEEAGQSVQTDTGQKSAKKPKSRSTQVVEDEG